MPTLDEIGTFSFREGVDIPLIYKDLLTNTKAVDIITRILYGKMKEKGKPRFYFLQGRTGSGKSTLFIAKLFQRLCQRQGKSLICTQPRTSLVQSNALGIASFYDDLKIGKNIALQTGNLSVRAFEKSSIKFMTTQILTNILINSPEKLKNVGIIVIDEVHVMDLPMIVLLRYVKQMKDSLPLVIFQSATFDVERYVRYLFKADTASGDLFESEADQILEDYSSIGYVSGESNFEVVERYLVDPIGKVIEECCQNLFDAEFKDILIFTATKSMIRSIGEEIEKYIKYPMLIIGEGMKMEEVRTFRGRHKDQKRVLFIGYARNYGEASEYLNTKGNKTPEEAKNEIRIYCATTIVEVGKTYKGLAVCIDTGVANSNVIIPNLYNINALQASNRLIPINMNQLIQRKGRVGRSNPGIFIGLYPEELTQELLPEELPQIWSAHSISSIMISELKTRQTMKEANTEDGQPGEKLTSLDGNPNGEIIDLMNINPYIYKASIDTLLMTARDLINSGVLTYDGMLTPGVETDNNWYLSRYLFTVQGLTPFEACRMSVMLNRSFEDITDFHRFKKIHATKEALDDEYSRMNDRDKLDILLSTLEVYFS